MRLHVFTTAILLGGMMLLSSFAFTNYEKLTDGFTYFKTFNITHESAELGNDHIEHKILLNKNIEYNFVLENNDCDVVIQMHDDQGKKVLTNFDEATGACLKSVIFNCHATKLYTISLDPKRSKAHGVCKVGFKKL